MRRLATRTRTRAAPVAAPVLAIFAHPDDAELACGASMALLAASGRPVHIVTVCRGDKGAGEPTDGDALAKRRAAEGRRAAQELGVTTWTSLDRADGEVDNDGPLRAALVEQVRSIRPDLVITGDPTASFFGGQYVNHRDHRQVGWAVLDAVAPAAANPNYFPSAGAPHHVRELWLANSLEPDHWVDVADVLAAKAAAVWCHRSQLGAGGEIELGDDGDQQELLLAMLTERAASEGRRGGYSAAEGFRRLALA